jgi:hypothetical protein
MVDAYLNSANSGLGSSKMSGLVQAPPMSSIRSRPLNVTLEDSGAKSAQFPTVITGTENVRSRFCHDSARDRKAAEVRNRMTDPAGRGCADDAMCGLCWSCNTLTRQNETRNSPDKTHLNPAPSRNPPSISEARATSRIRDPTRRNSRPGLRRYRTEAFCYGPRSCPLYRSGPERKVRDIDREAASPSGACRHKADRVRLRYTVKQAEDPIEYQGKAKEFKGLCRYSSCELSDFLTVVLNAPR